MTRTFSFVTVLLAAHVLQLPALAGLRDGELSTPVGKGSTGTSKSPYQGMVVYVNGQNTDSGSARATAEKLSEKLGTPVRVCFNDLTLSFVDWFSTLIEKLGDADLSVNAATRPTR
jgi:hypothetical protein